MACSEEFGMKFKISKNLQRIWTIPKKFNIQPPISLGQRAQNPEPMHRNPKKALHFHSLEQFVDNGMKWIQMASMSGKSFQVIVIWAALVSRRNLRLEEILQFFKMEKTGGANRVAMLAVCVAAIYAAYIAEGVVQENV